MNMDTQPSTFKLEPRYCTLCGPEAGKKVKYPANFSAEDFSVKVFSARRAPDRRHFQLIECERCRMIYSDPACDPSHLATLYHDATVNYGEQEEQIYESYAAVLDRALPRVGKRGVFLEIGGGNGFMLRYGARHGFAEQIEIEPSKDAELKFKPASANARFIRGIFTRGTLPPASVSMACFFQMLDHVPDPFELVSAVFEALEPGGVVVSVTHNTQALSAKLLGERSPIFDIEHTYLFNPHNKSELFRKAGFDQVDAFSVANRYALRHWFHLAPVPGKKTIAPVLEKTGLAGIPIKLNAGNFGVIGIKPGSAPGSRRGLA
jgi:SAM-dependent methyltransferase